MLICLHANLLTPIGCASCYYNIILKTTLTVVFNTLFYVINHKKKSVDTLYLAHFMYLKVQRDLDVSVHGGGLSSPDQPLQLGTAVVLSFGCQFLDVDIGSEQVEASHLVGVDGQDLDTALLIRQTWRWDDEAARDRGRWVERKDGPGVWKGKKWVVRGQGERSWGCVERMEGVREQRRDKDSKNPFSYCGDINV